MLYILSHGLFSQSSFSFPFPFTWHYVRGASLKKKKEQCECERGGGIVDPRCDAFSLLLGLLKSSPSIISLHPTFLLYLWADGLPPLPPSFSSSTIYIGARSSISRLTPSRRRESICSRTSRSFLERPNRLFLYDDIPGLCWTQSTCRHGPSLLPCLMVCLTEPICSFLLVPFPSVFFSLLLVSFMSSPCHTLSINLMLDYYSSINSNTVSFCILLLRWCLSNRETMDRENELSRYSINDPSSAAAMSGMNSSGNGGINRRISMSVTDISTLNSQQQQMRQLCNICCRRDVSCHFILVSRIS